MQSSGHCPRIPKILVHLFKITGQSYLLWAIENYGPMCKLADEIVAKEGEDKVVFLSVFALHTLSLTQLVNGFSYPLSRGCVILYIVYF